jgi:hypothetical protein
MSSTVEKGLLTEAELDRAAVRTWRTAFRLGMFEYSKTKAGGNEAADPWADLGFHNIDSANHRAEALSAAKDSLVLLKNDPAPSATQPDLSSVESVLDPVLPLSLDDISKGPSTTIAVIGPFQNVTKEMQGGYSGTNHLVDHQSPGEILALRVAAFNAALGRDSSGGKPISLVWHAGVLGTGSNDTSLIADAAAVAGAASVAAVLLFVGDVSVTEFMDRTDNGLIYAQEQLIKAVTAQAKPTVLVVIAGHSLALPEEATSSTLRSEAEAKASVNAVLYAFLPSQAGGTAIVSTLLGDPGASPAGRLPITFYDRSLYIHLLFSVPSLLPSVTSMTGRSSPTAPPSTCPCAEGAV